MQIGNDNLLMRGRNVAIITKIQIQQKNKSRFNIFIDKGQGEEYGFSVHENVLIRHRLQKGMEIDDKLLVCILHEEEINKAYLHGIHYLSYGMRSEKEIVEYLELKEYEGEAIVLAIEKLKRERYIDNRAFAKAYVLTKKNTTSKGPLLIKRELIEKGIKGEELEVGMQEFPFDQQIEKATEWVTKKAKQSNRHSQREQLLRLKNQLRTKGYGQEVIEGVFRERIVENDESEEVVALQYHRDKALRKYRNLSGFELKMKVKQYLYRRGFKLDDIERFLNKQ